MVAMREFAKTYRHEIQLAALVVAIIAVVLTIVIWRSDSASVPIATKSAQDEEFERGTCGSIDLNRSVSTGWGPSRELFTIEDAASYPTINSITNNPNWGDERAFFTVKDLRDMEPEGFCSSMQVSDGNVLLLRVYLENSGPDPYSDPEYGSSSLSSLADGSGVARDVTVQVVPDEQIATLRHITAIVSSSTTTPKEIWHTIELAADDPFRLDYVQSSAKLYSNAGSQEGFKLADSIWNGAGALVGYETMDGRLQPGYQYSVIITLEVRVTAVG